MGDIQTRPFSKNYSGLINQSVIALGITVICVTSQELMKRRRRGKGFKLLATVSGLGSRESWEFNYLYNGRSWARFPSPISPFGWPLSWVKQVVQFPEDKLNELRGLDATIYIRFLRGTFWFTLAHTLTTFPILFPIHVHFSDPSISSKSMTRASISSLVGTNKGLSLLWIHACLLFWVTLSWIFNLVWICTGTFKLRAANLEAMSKQTEAENYNEDPLTYYRHPHPQYAFTDVPRWDRDCPTKGLRLRTVMISNIPISLRSEKALQEYFEHYMSRKVEKPSVGLTSSTPPSLLNKSFAFIFNRAKRLPAHLPANPLIPKQERDSDSEDGKGGKGIRRKSGFRKSLVVPKIERIVIARKMTELASLLQRREDILVQLETAHIKLANNALLAVKAALERKEANKPISYPASKALEISRKRRSLAVDPELADTQELDEQAEMDLLIDVLRPFVEQFGTQRPLALRSRKAISRTSRQAFHKLRPHSSVDSVPSGSPIRPVTVPSSTLVDHHETTVWDALLSLPRSSLDAYQPLVNLSQLFRGKIVPSIDYYTTKLNLLTSLISENRAKAIDEYDAVSTAFVTFADPADARRACKYLAVHPNDPLACLVTMAPMYQDIDWIRLMKSTNKGEFVKDWVVNLGVWGFTLFWLFPVSLLVGLVSIQNISLFWPSLKHYLDHHAWQSEVLQSFIPTLLVALLTLLIPLILLLIAKKAHTISTLSALHDRIMTRYYKFLIVNVLVFFCVGTAALQSFLQSFRSSTKLNLIQTVADSFPTAGPFYVGWLIFTTALHGGFELALLGLPLILYPSTSRQVTPRRRAVGIRPRTYNYYYWLPNHTLVIHVLLLFSLLNPVVLPFGTIYFFVQSGVIKNQFIHVYAKNYEGDGRVLLIRIVRYTLDGLTLAQAVFLGYMVVLKKSANVGLAAFLIVFTVLVKLIMTRMCRAQFEQDDIAEADIVCQRRFRPSSNELETDLDKSTTDSNIHDADGIVNRLDSKPSVLDWRLPAWINFSYSIPRRGPGPQGRHVDPFKSQQEEGLSLSVSQPSEGHVPDRLSPQEGPSRVTAYVPDKGYPWNVPEAKRDPRVLNICLDNLDSDTTVPHPPPVPWDDQAVIDLPYDNPFYTRTIDNILWLPRNPTSVLDLEDTVDMKISITVEASVGRLGTWLGLGETMSPISAAPTPSLPEQTATSPVMQCALGLPEVDGTENIDLPPVIAQRVQAKEGGVEQALRTRKSSIYSRRPSIGDKNSSNSASVRPQRPQTTERPTLPTYRSFSDATSNRPRSSSLALQVPSSETVERVCLDQEPGIRPDAHAQAEFVAANTSRISLKPPNLSRTPNVSAAQAIFHEVVQEERQALWDRLEEETAEAKKSKSTKSWLTSWMFRKTG